MKKHLAGLAAVAAAAAIAAGALAPRTTHAQAGVRASPPMVPAVRPPASADAPASGAVAPGQRPPIVVAPDRRIPLIVSAEERARVLADMRTYLTGIQAMIVALGQRDVRTAGEAARRLADLNVHDVKLAEPSSFDAEFRELGTSMRRDFGRMATEAGRHGDAKQSLGQMGIAMQKCLACHRTFQLNEAPLTPEQRRAAQEGWPNADLSGMADRRVPLAARPNERAYVLSSMRLYLTGLQAMAVAISQDDWATVEDTARSMGTINVYDVSLAFASKYDVSFRDMAFEVQKDFDAIAKEARQRDGERTLGQVGETMRKCIACHQTFQLRDAAHSGSRELYR